MNLSLVINQRYRSEIHVSVKSPWSFGDFEITLARCLLVPARKYKLQLPYKDQTQPFPQQSEQHTSHSKKLSKGEDDTE